MKPVEVEILMKGNSLNQGLSDAKEKSDLLTLSLKRLAQVAGGVLSAQQAIEFAKAMVKVRGEVEKLSISFETMLGDKGAARELMEELKVFAARTPLQLTDLAKAEQTLLSFNVPAGETMDILHAIGDISMGDGQKLQSLTLAFSQMSSTGKLMGQDLLQMINAGFNPLSVISEKTGKSIGTLKEEMSQGAISAEMVKDAFVSATSEGGKFYKMLEKQSESIEGSLSNLRGAWDDMLNSMGSKTQDTMTGGVKMLTELVQNYEQVGKVLTGLIVTYGAYRAAVMLCTAAERTWTVAELAHFKAMQLAAKAQALLNATMLTNPYVLATVAIVGLVAAVWALHDSTTAAEREAARLQEREAQQKSEIEDLKTTVDGLIRTVEDETAAEYDRQDALEDLKELMPGVFAKYKTEEELLKDLTNARKAENEEIARRNNLLGKQNYNEDKSQLSQWQRYMELHNKSKGHTDRYSGLSHEEYSEFKSLWVNLVLPEMNKTKSEFESFDSWLNNQIKALSGTVNQEAEKERQKAATSWNSKLQTMDVKELEGDIDRNKKRLKTMDESGKDYILMDGIPIHRSELERRIKEGSSRKKTLLENGRKDFAKDAKEQLQSEQKVLKELASLSDPTKRSKSSVTYEGKKVSEMSESEYRAAIEAQQKKVDGAKGVVDSYEKAGNGGETVRKSSRHGGDQRQQAEKEIGDAVLKQRMENEKALNALMEDGVEKRLRTAETERDQKIALLDKEQEELAKKRQGGLTAGEKKVFDDGRANAEKEYQKTVAELRDEQWKKERAALEEYLKEYGSYEEKKAAIRAEYERRMGVAETVGERASLMMQRDGELEQLDKTEKRIDWSGVLGDLKSHTKEWLEAMRGQLQGVLDEGALPVEGLRTVAEKIREVDGYLSDHAGLWEFMGEKAKEHKRLLDEASEAQMRQARAVSEESKAAGEVARIQGEIEKNGGRKGATSATLLQGLTPGSGDYKKMQGYAVQLAAAEGKLAKARAQTVKATEEAAAAEDKAKRDSAQAIADWFSDAQEFIAKKGIDQIPDLLSSIGLGDAGDKASKGLSGFSNAAGAAADLANHNYVGAALKAVSAVKDFGSALGIGGGNKASVAETTERLTKANEELAKRISDLTDAIGDSAGVKALTAYETALEAQQAINQNNMEKLKAQMGYTDAHHSNAYYASDAEIASYNDAAQKAFKAAGLTGSTLTGLESIYHLTPEQLKAIRDFAPDLWKYLTEVGKYDKSEYWEAVVEEAGKVEALTEQINDNLTQSTFDGMRDSFRDSLTDMSSTAEDFTQSLEKMFFDAAVNSLVLDDEFDEWLQGWRESWAAATRDSDYDLMAKLRDEAEQMRAQLVAERDTLASEMGYSDSQASQSGKAGGFSAMSQEQGTKLEGLFTSGLMHWVSMDENLEDVASRMSAACEHLRMIESHTGVSAQVLQDIREEFRKMVKDGLKMK